MFYKHNVSTLDYIVSPPLFFRKHVPFGGAGITVVDID